MKVLRGETFYESVLSQSQAQRVALEEDSLDETPVSPSLWSCVLYLGPVHWNQLFPIADGDQQSPIEIETKEAKFDSSLRPLSIKYDSSSAKIISNSGHSFNVDFDDTEDKSGGLSIGGVR